jgi:hypothetical protein
MDQPNQDRGPWLWVGVGCAVLFLGALCLIPPAVYFLVLRSTPSDDTGPIVTPRDPALPPGPSVPGPGPALPPPPPGARHIVAEVTEATGLSSVHPGSRCELDVTREDRSDGTFWCNAQVRCGGELLYGGPNAGYFDCTLYEQPQRHVVGQDFNTSSGDNDAAMRLDTLGSELEVSDDASGRLGAFLVRARVTELR